MTDPWRVIIAGDWHGNSLWGMSVVLDAQEFLKDEDDKIILQLGDFGIRPGMRGEAYLNDLEAVLAEHDTELWFIDGNHEDFDLLARCDTEYDGIFRVHIHHLHRGERWTWNGRKWLALGGATSLDKESHNRIEGKEWWPQERITADQASRVINDGRADVMITHEVPGDVPHSFGPSPFTDKDIAIAHAHRRLLQNIVNGVQPSWLMHGHLHRHYRRMCDFGYGNVEVSGLGMDGDQRNWHVLDTKAMEWVA